MKTTDVLEAINALVTSHVLPPYSGAKIHMALNSKRTFHLPGWLDIFFEPSMAAIWVNLSRLERAGMITSGWFDDKFGPRKYRRRHYWLTDAGLTVLALRREANRP